MAELIIRCFSTPIPRSSFSPTKKSIRAVLRNLYNIGLYFDEIGASASISPATSGWSACTAQAILGVEIRPRSGFAHRFLQSRPLHPRALCLHRDAEHHPGEILEQSLRLAGDRPLSTRPAIAWLSASTAAPPTATDRLETTSRCDGVQDEIGARARSPSGPGGSQQQERRDCRSRERPFVARVGGRRPCGDRSAASATRPPNSTRPTASSTITPATAAGTTSGCGSDRKDYLGCPRHKRRPPRQLRMHAADHRRAGQGRHPPPPGFWRRRQFAGPARIVSSVTVGGGRPCHEGFAGTDKERLS